MTRAEIEELQKNGALLSRCVPGDFKLVDFGEDGVIRMRFAGLHDNFSNADNSYPLALGFST